MKFGDKISTCECCDKEKTYLQYSRYFIGWICEHCWESVAESVISGE
ncbi:hypothetical protein GCM10008935_29710 [Alkalibacillus silvisoli]|uniref:Sigma factor G inhibitor Gin n=1 Tax=Alkalibacillus silvisoli TaxID=392823 RepID=A0ABN1AAP8_9BACI